MAYDAKRRSVMLFGGGGRNDTWGWNGANWREMSMASTPPARTSGCMTYDAQREQVMLFGGVSDSGYLLNDTWIWEGTQWRRQYTPEALLPRCGACMTYDSTCRQVVLFGGQTYGGRSIGTLLNDTWIWDGSAWQARPQTNAPCIRQGACMTHHEDMRHTVLFGGTCGYAAYSDTWTWDGYNWCEQRPRVQPSARTWANLVYHQEAQQSVLVGGGGYDAASGLPAELGDTWLWNGHNWEEHCSKDSPAGCYHSATYDASRQAVVVYATGGSKPNGGSKTKSSFVSTEAAMTNQETQFWTFRS
jgi:hypothetical protein